METICISFWSMPQVSTFMSMFLVDCCNFAGGDLFTLVARRGRLTEHVSRLYVLQLLEAIAMCHNNGVVHHDIKLENILISKDGRIKLSDFGLSQKITIVCSRFSLWKFEKFISFFR